MEILSRNSLQPSFPWKEAQETQAPPCPSKCILPPSFPSGEISARGPGTPALRLGALGTEPPGKPRHAGAHTPRALATTGIVLKGKDTEKGRAGAARRGQSCGPKGMPLGLRKQSEMQTKPFSKASHTVISKEKELSPGCF